MTVGLLILEGENLDKSKSFPKFRVRVGDLFAFGGSRSFVILTALIIFPSMLFSLFTDLSPQAYVSATGVMSRFIVLGSIYALGGVGFSDSR